MSASPPSPNRFSAAFRRLGRHAGGIRVRLTLLFGGVSLILGILSTSLVEHLAVQRMTDLSGERLREISRSIASSISQSLVERLREIELTSRSPLLVDGDWTRPDVRTLIDSVKQGYRPYAWMGVADANGRVVVASGGLLEGKDVSQRPWFQQGRTGPFLGNVHEAVMLARYLQSDATGEPLRFIDFAAPVHDRQGRWLGVVATHAHWTWINAVIADGTRPENVGQGIEVFLLDHHDQVLYPHQHANPSRFPGESFPDSGYAVLGWGEQRYLTAQASVQTPRTDTLGWRILVRQPVAVALASVSDLRQHLLLTGVLISLLLVFLADRVALGFSQPLQQLARAAYRIDHGEESTDFPMAPCDIREVNELATSIRGMTATLFERAGALERINLSLEDEIRERTAQLREANQRLAALATTDGLTGVANRRRFEELLAQEWERARRAGTPLALLMLDIDFFKQYNDHYGHQAGDACLREVGRLLRETLQRAGDAVARYGGEEFVALLPETPAAGARSCARALCRAISAAALPHAHSPFGVVTVSIGAAALIPEPTMSSAQLVARADQALYQAKRQGRDQVWLWTDQEAARPPTPDANAMAGDRQIASR